jgi:amino acid permease
MIKKLSPLRTYFSLVKGFIAIGILYSPKNIKNGGWLWAIVCMVLGFFLTLVCLIKLIQARQVLGGGSFSEIA